MKLVFAIGLGLMALQALNAGAQSPASVGKILHETNFEKSEVGKVPDDFLVLDGGFAVKEEQGNKFLELPGSPLETYGLLFGPNTEPGSAVSARFFATSKGRRFPSFAVGAGGQAGYKLQVSPAKKLIELLKGDQVIHSLPMEWKPGGWTHLKLWVGRPEGGKISIAGKLWENESPEPVDWTISANDEATTFSGRASVWGTPYAGTPIWFDDLKIVSGPSK